MHTAAVAGQHRDTTHKLYNQRAKARSGHRAARSMKRTAARRDRQEERQR